VTEHHPTGSESAGAVADEVLVPRLSDVVKAATIVETRPRPSPGPGLTEAAIVVSGGRGANGDFGPAEAFADFVGAGVGASGAAVDVCWYLRTSQLGQTGKTVSQQLSVANGISGAI
jgi:electron transfer flavoprotein alpha subunit